MGKRINLVIMAVTLLISFSNFVHPQQTAPKKLSSGEAESWQRVEQHLNTIDQTLKKLDVDSRLAEIEKAVKDLKRSSLLSTLLPAIIAAVAAVVGLFIGGFVNDRLQRARLAQDEKIANAKADHERGLAEAKAKQDRELAERQSKIQIGNAVVEWQLKQLYLLYGPVRALLGQSFGLYRQMNKVLQHADGTRFRFISTPDAKGQNAEYGEEFQIRTSSQEWERFRTVMHIDQVYGRGYGVETYFDEIVSIGARTVTIIEQNAGYARPEEEQLMDVFAKYLAHFAVLKHLHGVAKDRLQSKDSTKKEDSNQQLKVDMSAVFPVQLHDLINQGFKAITQDIDQWRKRALA